MPKTRNKNKKSPPLRMSYGQAQTYLAENLNTIRQQIDNGSFSLASGLEAWKAACAHAVAATSQAGIPS